MTDKIQATGAIQRREIRDDDLKKKQPEENVNAAGNNPISCFVPNFQVAYMQNIWNAPTQPGQGATQA